MNITLALYMLAKGSKSQQVKLLQRTLIGWGYSVGVYGADGDFGAATEKRGQEVPDSQQAGRRRHRGQGHMDGPAESVRR